MIKIGAIELNVRKRINSDDIYITDNGRYIIDAKFKDVNENLERKINQIDGVIENGLFINYDNIEIIMI